MYTLGSSMCRMCRRKEQLQTEGVALKCTRPPVICPLPTHLFILILHITPPCYKPVIPSLAVPPTKPSPPGFAHGAPTPGKSLSLSPLIRLTLKKSHLSSQQLSQKFCHKTNQSLQVWNLSSGSKNVCVNQVRNIRCKQFLLLNHVQKLKEKKTISFYH